MSLINEILHNSNIRYFSLARYALANALKVSGIGNGDSVLIPEYICRDLIASITSINAKVLFYQVNSNLSPLYPPEKWPKAKAVLAVNYFGFAQNLAPFKRYTEENGAILIEDNAHGFLSKDREGNWLGMRTKIGIFSFRKTFCFPDGGALILNDNKMHLNLEKQIPFDGRGYLKSIKLKCKIKKIPFLGIYVWILIVWLVRAVRKIRTGHALPIAVEAHQYEIPYTPNPYRNLISQMKNLEKKENSEINRRRDLYRIISLIAADIKLIPIFDFCPDWIVPYGFPFRALEKDLRLFEKKMKYLGLDLIKWPDLPDNISKNKDYNNVWVVNFL